MEEQSQQQLDYVKRGKGRYNTEVKRKDFYKHYAKNHTAKRTDLTTYRAFLTELLHTLSTKIVTENLEVKIPMMGRFRIKAVNGTRLMFDEDGTIKLKADWKATWEHWYKKYPGLTRKEILAIPGIKVLYYENKHSQGEIYKYHWDKYTAIFGCKSYYKFIATRQYNRLLAQTVKDPNRKVFYYG
jgi:hypothetical protein